MGLKSATYQTLVEGTRKQVQITIRYLLRIDAKESAEARGRQVGVVAQ